MTIENTEGIVFHAITKRLEVVNPTLITDKLRSGVDVKGYWGTAPTGKPHIGYLVPLIKVAECIAAGVDVIVLVADSYAFLINHDVSMEVVEYRAQYYTFLLKAVLRALGVPLSKIFIERESGFCMTAKYCRDKMRLCAVSTQDEIRAVGAEVKTASVMSPLLCPIHQTLCDVYLGCDFQLGGFDQRGVFSYANHCLPRIGYEPITYLMAPMIPGLKSGKMSSSAQDDTKIMFSDSSYLVESKIADADITQKNPASNAILAIFQHVVFPAHEMGVTSAFVQVRSINGKMKQYKVYESLEEDFVNGVADKASLQSVLASELNAILEPIREEYVGSEKWRLADRQAYGDNTQV